MSTLKNKYVNDTYKSLLKLYENTIYTGNTTYEISDGFGNILPVSFRPNTTIAVNLSVKGSVFDNFGFSGSTNQVLSRGSNGLEWASPSIMISGNVLTLDIFAPYTASTQSQIDGKLDTEIFAYYTANTPVSLGLFSSGITTGATFRIDSNNDATGLYSTVSGGFTNITSGNYSSVLGGQNNTVVSPESVISGGRGNYIDGLSPNYIEGFGNGASSIGGGVRNTISGYYTGYGTIGGGFCNTISGPYSSFSTISGGYCNTASGYRSFIGSGNNNIVYRSIIVGGSCNAASNYSYIGNGSCNAASNYSFIGGGTSNTASGYRSSVIGGFCNTASGYSSFIGGGLYNTALGQYSFIGGGCDNLTTLDNTFILGSNLTATTINTTFVESLNIRRFLYDSSNTSGSTNQILTSTPSGILWVTAATPDLSTKLNISDFNPYSAYTLNLINNNYSQFTGFTQSFNSYSATTLNTINNNYSQFTGFTQSFNSYSATTLNSINSKLNISDFNPYSAHTLNLINSKYDKSGGIISGDVSILGNLTINGSATTVNTVNLVVYDPIIGLALSQSGTTTPTLDSGIITDRGISGNIAFVWIEGNKQYELGYTNNSYNSTNVIISRYGDLKLGGLKTSFIYDSVSNSGSTNQILTSTPSGILWVTAATPDMSAKLNVSDFNPYSAYTLNLINNNYSQFTGFTQSFNDYSATTLNTINNNYSQFTGFTQSFNSYSATTLNLINNKVIEGGSGVLSTVRINANNASIGNYSSVLGGTGNTANGLYSIITGGLNNRSVGNCSYIAGGFNNVTISDNTFILGTNLTGSTPNTTFVESLNITSRNIRPALLVQTTGSTSALVTLANGNTGVGTGSPLYRLDVSGTTNVMRVIGSASGSTIPIFTIQGSQGELFSVTDNLMGSLFSVNNISGIPILEVFSNDEIIMGDYQAPSLFTTKRTTVNSNVRPIYSFSTFYDGAFIDYTVRNPLNARSGQMMVIWSGTTINYSETTTVDIGNTDSINMYFIMSGRTPVLMSSASTSGWVVKTLIKSI